MRDYNWEDWHLRPDGSGEGALLKGKHLPGLCAVVAGAFWEDDHMCPPLFGLQLKFGSVECQILNSETLTILLDQSRTCLGDRFIEYLPRLGAPAPVDERRPVEVRGQAERAEVQEGLLGERGRAFDLGPVVGFA